MEEQETTHHRLPFYAARQAIRRHATGGNILILATILAMVIANIPAINGYYFEFWNQEVRLQIGSFNLFSHAGHPMSMLQFINDLVYHRVSSSDSDFRVSRLGFHPVSNHTLNIAVRVKKRNLVRDNLQSCFKHLVSEQTPWLCSKYRWKNFITILLRWNAHSENRKKNQIFNCV